MPPAHLWLGSTAMFDKEKAPTGFEYPAYLGERALDIGNAAQRPRRHDCVGARVAEGNCFSRALD